MSDTTRDAEAAWLCAREELRASVYETTFRQWFEPLRADGSRGPVLRLTGTPRVVKWVGRRYVELIRAALLKTGGVYREIELAVARDDSVEQARQGLPGAVLNPAYSFERFVIGPGNRLAHGAALAVAERPGQAYNPLFMHGPPGLGKTHLLGAIANYLASTAPDLDVHYTTAECFTNEFVAALRGGGEIGSFKDRYRRADVLLIDDVQFLEGKSRTADEFFHTFNALYDAGAQLVLSADRLPGELEALAERLRGRFEWGLVAEVSDPDLATRLTVIDRLVDERRHPIEAEAVHAIADRAGSNLRLLEGALTRVIALSSLTAAPITPALVAEALPSAEAAAPRGGQGPGLERIRDAVAKHFGLEPGELASGSRRQAVTRARQLAMFLTRELTDLSLPSIAAGFNRRDHTTVIHAIRRVAERSAGDPATGRAIEELRAQLSAGELSGEPQDGS